MDDTFYDQMLPFKYALIKTLKLPENLPYEGIYTASRVYSDEVFEVSQNGQMSMEDMYIYRVKKALSDFEIHVTDEEALQVQAEYARNQKKLCMSEVMEQMLDYLKQYNITSGVITNGPAQHQWNKVNALRLTKWINEENIFVSGEYGVAKPDIRIFKIVEATMKLCKNEVYFIGDSYVNDIQGANAAGWKTVWVNRRGGKIEPSQICHNYEVTSDEQLFELLKKLYKG